MNRRWEDLAACASPDIDPGIFFPDHGEGPASYKDARQVCAGCPVKDECLEDAMATESGECRFGMRGGYTPRARRMLGKTRAAAHRQEQAA